MDKPTLTTGRMGNHPRVGLCKRAGGEAGGYTRLKPGRVYPTVDSPRGRRNIDRGGQPAVRWEPERPGPTNGCFSGGRIQWRWRPVATHCDPADGTSISQQTQGDPEDTSDRVGTAATWAQRSERFVGAAPTGAKPVERSRSRRGEAPLSPPAVVPESSGRSPGPRTVQTQHHIVGVTGPTTGHPPG